MEGYPEHALPKRLNRSEPLLPRNASASKVSHICAIFACHVDRPVQYDFGRRQKSIVVAPKLAVSRDPPCGVRPATFPQWQNVSRQAIPRDEKDVNDRDDKQHCGLRLVL